MPKVVIFNGKKVIEPGAYSRVIGGETNPPDQVSFGKVLLIDNGSNPNYGWGAGIKGAGENGMNAVYEFTTIEDFRNALGGGIFWQAAKWLFKPSKDSRIKGVDGIYYVRAATTTQSTGTYTFTGGGANGGVFGVKTKVEGAAANGKLVSGSTTDLSSGFAMKMVAGTVDTARFKIQFLRGTFRGLDHNNIPFDNITEAVAGKQPDLLIESVEFDNVDQLFAWAKTDETFQSYFTLSTETKTGTGAVVAADLTANTAIKLFAGATTTYGATDYLDVFKNIDELDYTYTLSDKFEDNATHAFNALMQSHIEVDSEFQRILVIGGGKDSTKFTQTGGSIPIAQTLNSELTHVVHSRVYGTDANVVGGKREYSSFVHAAAYLGLIAGNEPQVPATFKGLDFTDVVHRLDKTQRAQALQAGVIHQRFVANLGMVVNQDVNTLQKNTYDIYEDGTSPHGSIMRIAVIINREITYELREKFVGQNANTASPADVKAAVEAHLNRQVALKTDDNKILTYKNVKVNLKGSDYKISFGFTPNGPVNRLFITGLMFNVDVSA